ncbi:hypothetical protein HanXRQr2_Chr09g0363661 [Helianthus annuus]|uniref:Uncharacterized protein n=1 Tax=Helianthus annuus TaxID=4232 RepID=A0A251TR01_HELAN|nr:hypothetical protein HanXRQr2_Chr09g0363661 [Helianthus annuus]KAJ0891204.1 hypothetical protein HanPSC8_Chr09g0350841 [Helianthus annuus]
MISGRSEPRSFAVPFFKHASTCVLIIFLKGEGTSEVAITTLKDCGQRSRLFGWKSTCITA